MIIFQPLREESVRRIMQPMLNEICGNLEKHHKVKLQIGEEAERFVTQAGYNPQYGVRELRRTVEKLIQEPLSDLILSGEIKRHTSWQIVRKDQGLSIIPQI